MTHSIEDPAFKLNKYHQRSNHVSLENWVTIFPKWVSWDCFRSNLQRTPSDFFEESFGSCLPGISVKAVKSVVYSILEFYKDKDNIRRPNSSENMTHQSMALNKSSTWSFLLHVKNMERRDSSSKTLVLVYIEAQVSYKYTA